MVVLVNGAAYRAQRIVAVGKGIRERELFQPRSLCRLHYSHVGYIVRGYLVELYFKLFGIAARVVSQQNFIRQAAVFAGFVLLPRAHELAARIFNSVFYKFYHKNLPADLISESSRQNFSGKKNLLSSPRARLNPQRNSARDSFYIILS